MYLLKSVSGFLYLCIFSCVPSFPYFYSSTSDQWASNDVKTNLCCWHIECSILTVSSFRIWNSSPGIPSPPLALFLVMLPKAHLTSHLKHKLESRLLEEVSKTPDMQMTPPLWHKVKMNWKASWKWKRRVKKLAWNSTFKKLRSWHPVPSLHSK